jgi:type VI protein secretion system component VasK
MWILQFLPDSLILWFTNIVLLAGVVLTIAGWFAHRIPVIYQYQLPFRIIGVVLLIAGVYLRGGYAVESEWRARVAELEDRLKIAQEASQQVNTQIETKVVTKTLVVKEKANALIQYVDREIFKDREIIKEVNICPVPQEAIDVHNEAARMNQAIEQLRKDKK